MRYNFTIRLYAYERMNGCLSDISDITVSDITLLSKDLKFGGFCYYKNNKKKFKYDYTIHGKFLNVAGSHSSPILAFKGDYLDIEVVNFPRFPVIAQDKYDARNILNGYNLYINNGFPIYLNYRKIEFLNIKKLIIC